MTEYSEYAEDNRQMSATNTTERTMVRIDEISPTSNVNVRRTGVDENAERLKDSILRYGFLSEHPVLLRPNPDQSSRHPYEVVAGQSRFKGAALAGLETIPAVVEDLTDEAAHLRSFQENEARQNLLPSDKTYWFEKQFKSCREQGLDRQQARQHTADHYGITVQTLSEYLVLTALPEPLLQEIDKEILKLGEARAIAKRYNTISADAEADQAMIDAARWLIHLPNSQRKLGAKAIADAKNDAATDDLQDALESIIGNQHNEMSLTVTPTMRPRLQKLAERYGFMDAEQVLPLIIANAIQEAGID